MKRNSIKIGVIITAIAVLTGCSSTSPISSKLADMQIQKKHLADGTPVSVAINLAPTANWGCESVGTPQHYNWASLQTQGAFRLTGDVGLLTDKALSYANQEELQANYINMQIPQQNTFSAGTEKFTHNTILNPNAQARVYYYQCERINPEHKLGVVKEQNVSVTVG